MQLSELYDYKNRLMQDLLTNPEIVRLIADCNIPSDPRTLAYKQVFPYEYIPETVEHGTTYVCFDVDVQKAIDNTYIRYVIYVWVMTHKSKLRLDEGGVRPDRIATEIADTINGSWNYGLGKLDLYSSKRWSPTSDYQGKVLTFHATEFNRTSATKHPVPANRKGD